MRLTTSGRQNSGQIVALWRGLDGVFYSLVALLALLLYPAVGRNFLGDYDIFCVLPVCTAAWFCLRLPRRFAPVPGWAATVTRLRVSVMLLAALSPLTIWWLEHPGDVHLLVNFLLSQLAYGATLFYLAQLCMGLCATIGHDRLRQESRWARHMAFWLLLVVVFGGSLVVVSLGSFLRGMTAGEYLATALGLRLAAFHGLSPALRWVEVVALCAALLPALFTASVLLRLRILLQGYHQMLTGD